MNFRELMSTVNERDPFLSLLMTLKMCLVEVLI